MRNISTDLVKIVEDVKSALETDIVSRGELGQIIADGYSGRMEPRKCMEEIIAYLLEENVQIGYAIAVEKYVKFVAWRGGVDERVERAFREGDTYSETDRAFAFWLCAPSNVDEFEKL